VRPRAAEPEASAARYGSAGTARPQPPQERPRAQPRPSPAQPRPSALARRPRPKDTGTTNGAVPNETLLDVLDHLNTLSQLVIGTSRASSTELDAVGNRVERAVADLDALQQRVVRSLAGFDVLRLRVQKELADRPPLSDEDVDRIADGITQRLLDHVRVEAEGGLR